MRVNQDFPQSRFYKATTVLLAIIVTVAVSLTIAGHWKTYDWISKFLAFSLLLNLAIVPLTMVVKLIKGEKAKSDILVQTAYIWVLLATMLFNR